MTFRAKVVAAAVFSVCLVSSVAGAKSDKAPAEPVKLQGGVVKVQTSLNELRDARLSVSRVRKSIANLYDEVTREEMTMTFNPNVIGTTIISTPMPVSTGMLLPARPKWVHASMDEMRPIINLFKEDVDVAIESNRNVEAPDSTKQQLEPIRNNAFAAVKSSFEQFQELESLTAGSSFDNNAIASAAKNLDKRMKELDKDLKSGIAILQKEAKAQKKRGTDVTS